MIILLFLSFIVANNVYNTTFDHEIINNMTIYDSIIMNSDINNSTIHNSYIYNSTCTNTLTFNSTLNNTICAFCKTYNIYNIIAALIVIACVFIVCCGVLIYSRQKQEYAY